MNSMKETEGFYMLCISTDIEGYLHVELLNVECWSIHVVYIPEYTDSEQSCHESSVSQDMIREKVHQMELNVFVDG